MPAQSEEKTERPKHRWVPVKQRFCCLGAVSGNIRKRFTFFSFPNQKMQFFPSFWRVPKLVVSGTPFLSGTVCGTRFAPFFCPKTKDLSDNIKKIHQDLKLTHGKNITCKFCKTQQFAAGTSAPAAAAVAVARQTWQQRWDRRPKTKGYDKNTSKPWSSVLLLLAGNLPIKGTINPYLYFMVYSCIFTEARTSIYRFYAAYRSQKSLMLLHRCTPFKNTWAWTCSCGKLEGNDSILF